ncbi:hypothetical protein EON65_46575 [archaeon]|nr:MAG: hypothetical protein EON65_46575 [archaeon]
MEVEMQTTSPVNVDPRVLAQSFPILSYLSLGDALHSSRSLSAADLASSALRLASNPGTSSIIPVVVDTLTLEGVHFNSVIGRLTATGGTVTGKIGGQEFSTQILRFDMRRQDTDPSSFACSVLNLEIGPINLNVLGLRVDTSSICLRITAIQGGGLLGSLLCGLAGGNLGNLQETLNFLQDLLTLVLSNQQAVAQTTQMPQAGSQQSVCVGDCEVLTLVIRPVTINLLGLNIFLDNCNNGPMQTCISATQGEDLLGSLLCSLT